MKAIIGDVAHLGFSHILIHYFYQKRLYALTLKSSSYWTVACCFVFTCLFFCRARRSSSDKAERLTGIF